MTENKTNIDEYIEMLKKGAAHLNGMAKASESLWDPSITDPRHLHNMFVKNLIAAYVSKFAELSDGILGGIEKSNYLIYALCGRALIETTAILRYYVIHQYQPLMKNGTLSEDELIKLIDIDNKHLRGSRFDWVSFLSCKYAKLKDDAIQYLKDKKKDKSQSASIDQVNVLTCIEKWAAEEPKVLIAYNLFCDLVHPNIGSTFLIASTDSNGLYFSKFKGEPVGKDIFTRSLPALMTATTKPFADYLGSLIATMLQEDEL